MPIGGEQKGINQQYLDDKTCFQLWIDLGSLQKAQKDLARNGVVNPRTGKIPKRMSIRIASHRYIIRNPEQARVAIANSPGGEWAEDRSTYYQRLDKDIALKVLSKKRYEEWQKKNKKKIKGLQ